MLLILTGGKDWMDESWSRLSTSKSRKLVKKYYPSPAIIDSTFASKKMSKKYRLSTLPFVIFCTLSCYSLGTAMMDYFLVYPSRFLVGEKEFSVYHKFLESAIMPISVFPFLAIIILNVLLLLFRPYWVSKTLVVISLVCLVLDFISTVFFQAPWNLQLSTGKNIELMQRITDTNWVRVFLEIVQGIVVVIMLNQGYSKISNPASANESRA